MLDDGEMESCGKNLFHCEKIFVGVEKKSIDLESVVALEVETTRSRRLEILVQVKTARSRSENQVKSARSTECRDYLAKK